MNDEATTTENAENGLVCSIPWVIRSPRGTYYRRHTVIGAEYRHRRDQALEFETKEEAELHCACNPCFDVCEVVQDVG